MLKTIHAYIFIILTLSVLISSEINAQNQQPVTPDQSSDPEMVAYKDKVKQLVSFLQFALNTIGNEKTPAREKDIIINSSYLKFFRDEKVQIEDDLDENRDVVTNKNVQSYLKDVDFFYKDAKFQFTVEEITHDFRDNKQLYFKVTLNRNLTGTNLNGEPVNNNKVRYIEINLQEEEKDLKIASIYTTRLSEEQELTNWWADLSLEWEAFFKKRAGVYDSITLPQIKELVNLETLDISGNKYLVDLEPLQKLTKLRVLNISNTRISSLVPLRNLTKLEILNCSNTDISTFEPLKYASSLIEIYSSNTPLAGLESFENFLSLKKLHIDKTHVADLSPLAQVVSLQELNTSGTKINSLNPLAGLTNLKFLDIADNNIYVLEDLNALKKLEHLNADNNPIMILDPLKGLEALKILFINGTQINSLEPLKALPLLERVYCDKTPVTKQEAEEFMKIKPGTLVIFESEGLQTWWNGLNRSWRKTFNKYVPTKETPDKEDLARIVNLEEIDISNDAIINSLEPLKVLRNLKVLRLNNTEVENLEPIKDLVHINVLEFSDTRVNSLEHIQNLTNIIKLDSDNTPVSRPEVLEYIEKNPDVLVIYKSIELKNWWTDLADQWKKVFSENLSFTGEPDKVMLHNIMYLDSLIIRNNPSIENLEPITMLHDLKILRFSNTRIGNISAVSEQQGLEVIQCSGSPITELSPLSKLKLLTSIDIENTPVKDLKPIENLDNLEVINCAGTQIKSLNPLSDLDKLKHIDCSNTRVRSLQPIMRLNEIQTLKCYNTRISNGNMRKFKSAHPEVFVQFY